VVSTLVLLNACGMTKYKLRLLSSVLSSLRGVSGSLNRGATFRRSQGSDEPIAINAPMV
jgi:hypothetical protein